MTHTLQAIAWTLIHFCWQAAAIAAAYAVANLAVARRSSNTRYVVALSALLLMACVSVATFAWELRANPSTPTVIAADATGQKAIAGGDFSIGQTPALPGSEAASEGVTIARLLPWIDGLWVLGVVVLSLRSIGGWWLLRGLRASASAQAPVAVVASFERICAALGLRRTVLLRVSNAIAGPMTVGALRAMVLLPLSAATNLSPEELEVVLAHELAHVRRADFAWNLLQTLAETLFFFHPAVWWVSARIRHERELCCDDLALKVCPNPLVYAHALFRLEEQRARQWRMAMALDGHQSPQTLRMRIARILGEPVARGMNRPVRPLSLAAGCAAVIALVLTVPQLLASLNPKPQAAPAPAVVIVPTPTRILVHPEETAVATVIAAPMPAPQATAQTAMPDPAPRATEAPEPVEAEPQDKQGEQAEAHGQGNYMDRMKAAGYDVDINKYISLKIMGVTPEYARAMAQVGFGKPSVDDLLACKVQGVTPETIAQMKQHGLEIKSLQDAISYHLFEVTPEFAAGMKQAGFDGLTSQQMLAMRVQGVTPEYARTIKQQFPSATADDVIKTRIFRIDARFMAEAKAHGFNDMSLEKLVQLRISGILDDESNKQ